MTTTATNQIGNIPKSITWPLKTVSYILISALILIVLWAKYAPLVTTIRANGTLLSAQPSYDIQHSYGGRIRKVFISSQHAVKKDQILFEMDVRKQEKILVEITSQISALELENLIIRQVLKLTPISIKTKTPSVLAQRYAELRKQLSLNIHSAEQTGRTSQQRAQSIKIGIDILNQRRTAMNMRSERLNTLVKKGIFEKFKIEAQSDLILTLDGEINTQNAQLVSLQAQAAQADMEIQKLKTQFRVSLLTRFSENKTRLPELRRQSLVLDDEINSAIIRSPISGTAVYVGYNTNQMYVTRGTTLVTLSQDLTQPVVQLLIPTQAIDQVAIGMIGKLTIPSIPQRNLPQIRITLKSISPDAVKDSEGKPSGYRAHASIGKEDFDTAIESLNGNLHLATDMPVTATLEGRKVTFSQYLIGPFFKIFDGAFQD